MSMKGFKTSSKRLQLNAVPLINFLYFSQSVCVLC